MTLQRKRCHTLQSYLDSRHFRFKDKYIKSSIYEITSISIEDNHDINGSKIEGEFIISGDYRLHEISINKEDFCFKLPYTHELPSNINLDTVELEITDFNYEFNNNDELKRLLVHGILHLNGMDHGEEHIEKGVTPVCEMLQKQEKILELLKEEKIIK